MRTRSPMQAQSSCPSWRRTAAMACCNMQNIAPNTASPLIFDPGQGMPMFSGDDLKHFIDLATYVAVNDYEAELLTARTGLSLEQIAKQVSALIVTRGELGAEIFTDGQKIDIPCVQADAIADPTGCGDAFRAGMLFG